MSLYPQTPQSIGQVLDSGFGIYRRIFKQVFPASLLVAILSQAPQLAQLFGANEVKPPLATVLVLVALLLAWLYVYLSIYNGWLIAMDAAAQGKPMPGTADLFRTGRPRVGAALIGGLLYGLFVAIGCILLVVPGIYLMTALVFFWYFVVLDGMSGGESLSASRALVKGHWWRTTTVITVAGLIYFVVLMLILGIAGLVFGVSAAGFPADADKIKEAAPRVELGLLVVQVAISSVLLPMWNAVMLVLFRDLKLRKSGTDLAARAAAA